MTVKTDVTRHLLDEQERLDYTAKLFGAHFPLRLEPVIYTIAMKMSPEYRGGYWQFWRLSNGGFLMAPTDDRRFTAQSMNGWQGELSADALGVVACLTAYSHLSFTGSGEFPRECARQYHLLRELMYEHEEVSAILSAID